MRSEFITGNYDLYRTDRKKESGYTRSGGVLISVNKKFINSHLCETLDIDNVNYEQIYVSVIKDNREFIIGGVYIPHKPKIDIYQDFSLYVEDIANTYGQIHREVHFCCDDSSLVILKPKNIKY